MTPVRTKAARRAGPAVAALAVGLLAAAPVPAQPAKKTCVSREEAQRLLELEKEKVFRRIVPRSRKPRRYLSRYRVIVSEHFLIFTNGPVSTRRFKVSLEKLYRFTREYYPFVDESRPLKCYIFKSKEEYWDFSEKVMGFRGARATAGHANARYYATFYQSPTAPVVFHEATHLLVNAVCQVRGGGSWFQEGTAVFIEKHIAGGKPSQGMRSRIRYGRYYPLRKLAAIRTLLADGRNGPANYAQAGSLLEFMVLGPLKDRFPKYMEYLRTHRSWGVQGAAASIRAVYGLTLEDFDRAWMEYCGWKPRKR